GLDALGLPRYGSRDPAQRAGIVTVSPEAVGQGAGGLHAEALYGALAAEGVMTAVRDRKLRFASSYTNTAADIDRALDVVATALGRRVGVEERALLASSGKP
ncbi:MAG: hypothetical protein AAGG50_19185, partial [Bacteroidota bacterium]